VPQTVLLLIGQHGHKLHQFHPNSHLPFRKTMEIDGNGGGEGKLIGFDLWMIQIGKMHHKVK
jgi:hypothetical protein